MRVFAGVGAWLIGVGAATAGSLMAVSLLGQGIATSTSQQLTENAVKNALAVEAAETQTAGPEATTSPSPTPSATRSRQAHGPQALVPQAEVTPSAQASRSRPAPSPSAQAAATVGPTSAGPSSTELTSVGGTAVAQCRPGGAYLVSWSPNPGYEAGAVVRGPALTAQVTFDSTANSVIMTVSCSAGTPTATSTVNGSSPGSGGSSTRGPDE